MTSNQGGKEERRVPNDGDDLKYQVYLDERKSLVDAEREGARLFDKAILTLSGGAFGLSITFIRNLAPEIKPETLLFLICAWAGFGVSLLLTLSSFLMSQWACTRQRDILEKQFFAKRDADLRDANHPAMWTKRLNVISILAFIGGISCLALFSVQNLPVKKKEDAMAGKEKERITEGFVPPTSPKEPGEIIKGFVPPTLPKEPRTTQAPPPQTTTTTEEKK